MGIQRATRLFGESILDPILMVSRRAGLFCAWAGGMIFFLSAFLISVEVFIRKAFSLSMSGADELTGYGFAIAMTFAFGYAMLERAHIRVDSAYIYLPIWIQALLDVAAALLLLFFALLTRYGWEVVASTWRLSSHSATPLNIPLIYPQFVWWLGLLATLIVTVLILLRAVLHLLLGELNAARDLIGSRGLDEEIADELAVLDERKIADAEGQR